MKTRIELNKIDCTRLLICINVVYFLCMVASSNWRNFLFASQDALQVWGANIGALTVNGQYWRLFSSMFLHASILHLGLNMYALWVFGPMVATAYGASRFIAIYVLSGLSGALASMVWNPTQTSAGASGALVGLAGAMLASMLCHGSKESKQNRFVHPLVFFGVICASLLYGFFDPQIDNAAHIGGLAGGFISGMLLQPNQAALNSSQQKLRAAALAIIAIFVAAACMSAVRTDKRSQTYRIASSAMAHLRANQFEAAYSDYDQLLRSELNSSFFVGRSAALTGLKQFKRALEDSERAIALDPRDQNAFLAKARALHELHQDEEAIKVLNKVILSNPLQPSAYNSRAWSEIAVGQYKQALSDANRCLALDPRLVEALDTRGLAYYCLKQYEKARNDFDKGISLKPEDGACHYHKAMLLEKLGQNSEASREFALAKELAYNPDPWELPLRSKK